MKKSAVILVSLGGFFIVLYIIARVTHILSFYSVPSTANLPTIRQGSWIFASKLKSPERGDFICFKASNENKTWMFRCIGKAGDIIEIKNALIYLNGRLLNELYTWNDYYISKAQLATIEGYVEKYKYPVRSINDSLWVITFSKTELNTYHLNLKSFTASKGQNNPEIFQDFRKLNYNEDNLGPVKVPPGSFFLMGDNRHDAMDSRYIGFIKQSDIISTVISH